MSALNRGMGGTGIGVRDGFNLNFTNPASYGSIISPVTSVFEMGFYIGHDRYTTEALSESRTNGGLSNINYWFKFLPQWSSTVGLTPFSSVSYKVNTMRSLGGSSNLEYTYDGSGTISRLYWGNAFNILKSLSFGVNISYLFGTISRDESVDIPLYATSLIYQNKTHTNKVALDVGLQYEIHLKKNRSLVVGLVGDLGATFKGNQKNLLLDGSLDTLQASSGDALIYEVPKSGGLGIGLHTARSILAADATFENWGAVSTSEQETSYQDVFRFSMGYMYKGNLDAPTYLGTASLRAGFHVQQYPLAVKGTALPWWGLTAGMSLPMFDNRSSITVSYTFDSLGTMQNGLLRQHVQQIMFDVVIRDLWGIRRKFD